jgi:hypothetical protein
MNAMTATTMLAGGDWFKIEGCGCRPDGKAGGYAEPDLPVRRIPEPF